jgi:hypothetical protein
MREFKNGDIVYFKEPHSAFYTSGHHEFHPGPYKILDDSTTSGTCVMLDLMSTKSVRNHFIFNSNGGYDKLITIDEWRQLQLSKIDLS